MKIIKKIKLVPDGTTHSVEPKVRPSFNEWQHELRSRKRLPVDREEYFDYEEDSIESLWHKTKCGFR